MRGALLGIAVPTEVAKSKALHLLQPHSFERPLVSTTWAAWRSGGSSREPRARGTVPGLSPGAQSRGSVPGGWCVGGVRAGPWRRSQPWLGGRSKSSSDRACSGQEAGAPVHWSVMIWRCTVVGRRVCAKDNMSGALLHTPLRFLETLLECCEFIRTR